jgi:hypothetical protein
MTALAELWKWLRALFSGDSSSNSAVGNRNTANQANTSGNNSQAINQQNNYFSPSVNPTPAYADPNVDLRLLNKADLRERTLTFAHRMRSFESGHKTKSNEMAERLLVARRGFDEEQRIKRWQADSANEQSLRAQHEASFRSTILPQAQALEQELCSRLGQGAVSSRTRPHDVRTISLIGFLAGPSPLSDTADYLEEMARSL